MRKETPKNNASHKFDKEGSPTLLIKNNIKSKRDKNTVKDWNKIQVAIMIMNNK